MLHPVCSNISVQDEIKWEEFVDKLMKRLGQSANPADLKVKCLKAVIGTSIILRQPYCLRPFNLTHRPSPPLPQLRKAKMRQKMHRNTLSLWRNLVRSQVSMDLSSAPRILRRTSSRKYSISFRTSEYYFNFLPRAIESKKQAVTNYMNIIVGSMERSARTTQRVC